MKNTGIKNQLLDVGMLGGAILLIIGFVEGSNTEARFVMVCGAVCLTASWHLKKHPETQHGTMAIFAVVLFLLIGSLALREEFLATHPDFAKSLDDANRAAQMVEDSQRHKE